MNNFIYENCIHDWEYEEEYIKVALEKGPVNYDLLDKAKMFRTCRKCGLKQVSEREWKDNK